MAMKKVDLAEKVKRRLGAPMVKVELDPSQIYDNIDYAREQYIKWAVGNATQEHFFTLMLSASVATYDMPAGVVEVIGYETRSAGSIHTLFTVENYLYNMGMYDQLLMRGASTGYTLVSYHIARDFLETVKRYVVDAYTFKYHKYENTLEIFPTPPTGGTVTVDDITYDSPGFILVRAYMAEGDAEDLYGLPFLLDYVTALCKISLGRVRSKFANFTAIGSTTALALDGDALISEGKEELEVLNEKLRNEECYMGMDIAIG